MAIFDPTRFYENATIAYNVGIYDGFSPAPGAEGPWEVLMSIDLSANGVGDWFTLDDPVKGVLDNTTYKLAGDVLVDISGWVRNLEVKRGRSRQLERFTAGNCSITFDNRERLFDPTLNSSPFYGSIVPRKQIVVTKNNTPVFSGNVQDWGFSFDLSGDATATASSVDGFAYIAPQTITPGTATSQLAGARINYALDDINWPAGQRVIDAGARTLAADVIPANQNALAYMQKVETSENGALFIGKTGLVTFRDSASGGYSGVEFGQDGCKFVDYQVIYGTEEMWNKVNVTYSSGTVSGTVTAEDATSQTAYGVFEVTYETLLGTSVAATSLANDLLARYKQPRYRVDSITVDMQGIASEYQTQVMNLEMADKVLVKWTPNFGSEISQYCQIDAIQHRVTPVEHFVTFTLSETTI